MFKKSPARQDIGRIPWREATRSRWPPKNDVHHNRDWGSERAIRGNALTSTTTSGTRRALLLGAYVVRITHHPGFAKDAQKHRITKLPGGLDPSVSP